MDGNIIAFKESEAEARPDAHDQSHCSSIQFVVMFSFSHKTCARERDLRRCLFVTTVCFLSFLRTRTS